MFNFPIPKPRLFIAALAALLFISGRELFAQDPELKFNLDISSATVPLPKIFKPSVDLSGRGFHRQMSWPQGLAAPEALDAWQKDIGFPGIYRLQYNLWEIYQLAKNKQAQSRLLANYEDIIKRVSDAGGVVILDIFGSPPGLGKVLDKKSPPVNLRAFKEIIKEHIRYLSCDKRYNIWYEVWTAPDVDDFFLGRKQEYLNLYRTVAEAIKELEAQVKIHIPVGGPAISAWFQNIDPNNVLTPEHSLIYDLIRFCYGYHLPLDFISWHAFSTAPAPGKEMTIYDKPMISLIRAWLTYFKFDSKTPLIVDEWNYDRGGNVLTERGEQAYVSASYVPARIKNMHEAGLDYQVYFSLEDFQDNREGVVRNTGVFWFDSESSGYKGGCKATYNVFRMLSELGNNMFSPADNTQDEFVGAIATKSNGAIIVLVYNYIDPDIASNFISQDIATFNSSERQFILNLIKYDKLSNIIKGEVDVGSLRTTKDVKNLLNKAKELNNLADKFKSAPRNIKIAIKKLNGTYTYQRYGVDESCGLSCKYAPVEEKEFTTSDIYEETLATNPYSVNMIILKPKPKEPEITGTTAGQEPTEQDAGNVVTTNKQ